MCDVSCSLFPVGGASVKRAAKASYRRVSINGSSLLSVFSASYNDSSTSEIVCLCVCDPLCENPAKVIFL